MTTNSYSPDEDDDSESPTPPSHHRTQRKRKSTPQRSKSLKEQLSSYKSEINHCIKINDRVLRENIVYENKINELKTKLEKVTKDKDENINELVKKTKRETHDKLLDNEDKINTLNYTIYELKKN